MGCLKRFYVLVQQHVYEIALDQVAIQSKGCTENKAQEAKES
jgi:hypothetical protein